jgi:hypothetical protein
MTYLAVGDTRVLLGVEVGQISLYSQWLPCCVVQSSRPPTTPFRISQHFYPPIVLPRLLHLFISIQFQRATNPCPLPLQFLRAKPDATYGLLGEVSASLADVHERVPLSDEEPLEILRHLWIYMGWLG